MSLKNEWQVTEIEQRQLDRVYGLYNSEYGYCSASGTSFPHWITLRNKNNKICVKSYAIRTRYNSSNSSNYNPQSWVLEGSDDNINWRQDRTGIGNNMANVMAKFFSVPKIIYYHE